MGQGRNGVGYNATAKLRRLRMRAALSLADVAQASGLSKEMVSKVERGDRRASPSAAARLVRVLGMTIDEALERRVLQEELGWPSRGGMPGRSKS